MRRIHIIYLTIFFYILLAALCPVFAKLYVDRKDRREYTEAYEKNDKNKVKESVVEDRYLDKIDGSM